MPGVRATCRDRAAKREEKGWRARVALPLLALALPGCVSTQQVKVAPGEEPLLVGPSVRDNRTPMDAALACYAGHLAAHGGKPLVVAVGDVRDYTGKYSVNEGNAITQGGALMVASGLGKLRGAVRIAERFDPTVAERELAYTDRRQLGDGQAHDLPGSQGKQTVPWLPYYGGSIAASDYYIVGGITEVNYDIRSGGVETGVNSIGPKARTYTEQVAIDLRIVDTHSLLVVKTINLAKQFTGYENGFGIFTFFGSNLFDINIGSKGQEPLQLGIRTALEEATMRLVGAVSRVDPEPCMLQASWEAPVPPDPPAAGVNAGRRVSSPAGGVAFNAPATGGSQPSGDTPILFEVGSDDLSGDAMAILDRIAASARNRPISLILVGRDTELLDPPRRQALSDRRIAALVEALGKRGIASGAIAILWRPDPADPSIQHDAAGLQRLARLKIG